MNINPLYLNSLSSQSDEVTSKLKKFDTPSYLFSDIIKIYTDDKAVNQEENITADDSNSTADDVVNLNNLFEQVNKKIETNIDSLVPSANASTFKKEITVFKYVFEELSGKSNINNSNDVTLDSDGTSHVADVNINALVSNIINLIQNSGIAATFDKNFNSEAINTFLKNGGHVDLNIETSDGAVKLSFEQTESNAADVNNAISNVAAIPNPQVNISDSNNIPVVSETVPNINKEINNQISLKIEVIKDPNVIPNSNDVSINSNQPIIESSKSELAASEIDGFINNENLPYQKIDKIIDRNESSNLQSDNPVTENFSNPPNELNNNFVKPNIEAKIDSQQSINQDLGAFALNSVSDKALKNAGKGSEVEIINTSGSPLETTIAPISDEVKSQINVLENDKNITNIEYKVSNENTNISENPIVENKNINNKQVNLDDTFTSSNLKGFSKKENILNPLPLFADNDINVKPTNIGSGNSTNAIDPTVKVSSDQTNLYNANEVKNDVKSNITEAVRQDNISQVTGKENKVVEQTVKANQTIIDVKPKTQSTSNEIKVVPETNTITSEPVNQNNISQVDVAENKIVEQTSKVNQPVVKVKVDTQTTGKVNEVVSEDKTNTSGNVNQNNISQSSSKENEIVEQTSKVNQPVTDSKADTQTTRKVIEVLSEEKTNTSEPVNKNNISQVSGKENEIVEQAGKVNQTIIDSKADTQTAGKVNEVVSDVKPNTAKTINQNNISEVSGKENEIVEQTSKVNQPVTDSKVDTQTTGKVNKVVSEEKTNTSGNVNQNNISQVSGKENEIVEQTSKVNQPVNNLKVEAQATGKVNEVVSDVKQNAAETINQNNISQVSGKENEIVEQTSKVKQPIADLKIDAQTTGKVNKAIFEEKTNTPETVNQNNISQVDVKENKVVEQAGKVIQTVTNPKAETQSTSNEIKVVPETNTITSEPVKQNNISQVTGEENKVVEQTSKVNQPVAEVKVDTQTAGKVNEVVSKEKTNTPEIVNQNNESQEKIKENNGKISQDGNKIIIENAIQTENSNKTKKRYSSKSIKIKAKNANIDLTNDSKSVESKKAKISNEANPKTIVNANKTTNEQINSNINVLDSKNNIPEDKDIKLASKIEVSTPQKNTLSDEVNSKVNVDLNKNKISNSVLSAEDNVQQEKDLSINKLSDKKVIINKDSISTESKILDKITTNENDIPEAKPLNQNNPDLDFKNKRQFDFKLNAQKNLSSLDILSKVHQFINDKTYNENPNSIEIKNSTAPNIQPEISKDFLSSLNEITKDNDISLLNNKSNFVLQKQHFNEKNSNSKIVADKNDNFIPVTTEATVKENIIKDEVSDTKVNKAANENKNLNNILPSIEDKIIIDAETKLNENQTVNEKKVFSPDYSLINPVPISNKDNKKVEIDKDGKDAIKVSSKDFSNKNKIKEKDNTDTNTDDNSNSNNDNQNINVSRNIHEDKSRGMNNVKAEDFRMLPAEEKTLKYSSLIPELKNAISDGQSKSLTISLLPEELGKVKLVVETIDKTVTAKIEVQNETVKAAVQSNIESLKQSLTQAGVNVNNIAVTISYSENKNPKQGELKRKNSDSTGKNLDKDNEKIDNSNPTKTLGYNTYEYLA